MASAFVAAFFVFSVWMLFDAIRRGAELYWYVVILVLPFGSVIYFLFVKIRDYDLAGALARTGTHPNVSELRQRATRAPSIENTLALAAALEQRHKYDQAARAYERIMGENPSNLDALHGLARCKLSLDETAAAVELLGRVIEARRDHADYRAALDYAEALWQNGQENDAVELAGALAEHTERPNHRLAHAHYLAGSGAEARARAVVEAVIGDLEREPASGSRDKWLVKAREMKARLG